MLEVRRKKLEVAFFVVLLVVTVSFLCLITFSCTALRSQTTVGPAPIHSLVGWYEINDRLQTLELLGDEAGYWRLVRDLSLTNDSAWTRTWYSHRMAVRQCVLQGVRIELDNDQQLSAAKGLRVQCYGNFIDTVWVDVFYQVENTPYSEKQVWILQNGPIPKWRKE